MSAMPSIGGMNGRLPVHTSVKRVCSTRSPTVTSRGPVTTASPSTTTTPRSRNRSGLSSVRAISACTAAIRRHTASRSIEGSPTCTPNKGAVRTVCATRALASSAFDGTQPVQRQSPPKRERSTAATRSPRSCAANSAARIPAEPIPMTTRSNSSGPWRSETFTSAGRSTCSEPSAVWACRRPIRWGTTLCPTTTSGRPPEQGARS